MIANNVARQLPILLFISFDGFRHDYISPTYAPNLFDLSKQATLGHMESLYITKTFPNHFSMVTGLYEDEHEIINNKMYDPKLNKTFKPGVISEDWWNPKGKTIPIWTANQVYGEQKGEKRISASMMYPGSSTPFMDTLPRYLKDFNVVRNWTKNVETVISWLTDPVEPANFVTMYFDDPDSNAHTYGPWGNPTLEAVKRVDSAAGFLVKRLREEKLADRTDIIFVSDHGMAEVDKVIYLDNFLDTSGFELHGNSPDWSIFVKPERRHQKTKIFRELLNASKKNHYKIYKREDVPPEFHYSKSARIGDFFLLVDEHYDLYKEKPEKPKNLPAVWGNHGWKPTDRDMRPLFMAYGPSFRQDYHHSEPFPNIDLFPLMVYLLDLPSEKLPNNGSLARIFDVIELNSTGPTSKALKLADSPSISTSGTTSSLPQMKIFSFCLIFMLLIVVLIILAYFIVIAMMLFTLSSMIFILLVGSNKLRTRFKPDVEFDDLAPGLNIDLGYYVKDDRNFDYKKDDRRRRNENRKEELSALLIVK